MDFSLPTVFTDVDGNVKAPQVQMLTSCIQRSKNGFWHRGIHLGFFLAIKGALHNCQLLWNEAVYFSTLTKTDWSSCCQTFLPTLTGTKVTQALHLTRSSRLFRGFERHGRTSTPVGLQLNLPFCQNHLRNNQFVSLAYGVKYLKSCYCFREQMTVDSFGDYRSVVLVYRYPTIVHSLDWALIWEERSLYSKSRNDQLKTIHYHSFTVRVSLYGDWRSRAQCGFAQGYLGQTSSTRATVKKRWLGFHVFPVLSNLNIPKHDTNYNNIPQVLRSHTMKIRLHISLIQMRCLYQPVKYIKLFWVSWADPHMHCWLYIFWDMLIQAIVTSFILLKKCRVKQKTM